MAKKVLFEYEGIKYYTYGELEQRFGLNDSYIRNRVNQLGWSMERALGLTGKYEIEGNPFNSLKEISEHYNVAYSTLCRRFKESGSLEVALGLNQENTDVDSRRRGNNTSPIGLWFREKYYTSLSKLAKEYGVDRLQFYHRYMRLNWTVEQALLLEARPGVSYLVEGKVYVGLADLAKAYGLNAATVKTRYKDLEWSIEEALEIVPRKTNRSVNMDYNFTYGDDQFKSLASACRKLNVNYRTVSRCVSKKGMGVVEAIDYVKKNGGDLKKKSGRRDSTYFVYEKPFNSTREIAEHFDVKQYSIEHRVTRYGMSFEEAIEDIKKGSNRV